MADIVLWRPSSFAAKPQPRPEVRLARVGSDRDPNASIDTVEPLHMGPQFGRLRPRRRSCRCCSPTAPPDETTAPFPTARRRVPCAARASVRLSQLVRNSRLADVRVDPRSAEVTMDGTPMRFGPVERTPLQRLYFL